MKKLFQDNSNMVKSLSVMERRIKDMNEILDQNSKIQQELTKQLSKSESFMVKVKNSF